VNFDTLKNTKAISYTLAIHLILLLIFFFVKYKSVALPPMPAEELIELETVALGTADNGFGIDPPEMVMGMPAPPATPTGEQSSAAHNNAAAAGYQTEVEKEDFDNDDVASVDHVDAAPVLKKSGSPNNPKPTEPAKKKNNPIQPTAKKESTKATTTKQQSTNTAAASSKPAQQQAKYTFEGGNGPGGNGADKNAPGAQNRGNGTGEGMMGRPGGDPNSMNFTGGITGRSIVARPDNKAEFRDGGTVKIKVWVNPQGQIIRYNILSAKNAAIRAIAEQKIKSVRFNKSEDAPAEQNGILTFNFKAGSGR
jgi:outer membrane biosynthesis protein TonB